MGTSNGYVVGLAKVHDEGGSRNTSTRYCPVAGSRSTLMMARRLFRKRSDPRLPTPSVGERIIYRYRS
jgi:hypothetical protein